jgi:peptidyl-prolyl cis-trans isomerase D
LVEETTKSFESVKSQLVKSIQGQEAENIFFEKSELLTNLVFENSDSLEPAANELELKIQQSDWFSRAGGNAFSQQPKIISTSFSDVVFKNRLNSEPIETSTNKLIVLRFKDSQPAKNKSLESVKKEIRATLKLEKSKAMVRVQGLKLFKELSNGGKLEDIAKKEKVSVVNKTDIMRNDTVIPNIIVSSVFKSIKPANGKATYSKAILPSGDYVLIQLTKVSNKVLDKTNKIDAIEKNKQLIQSIGTDEIEAVLSGLKKATDVQIFSDNL